MIKTVLRSIDNMVIVFDRWGEQIPAYQGQYEEVRESVLKDAPVDAIFFQFTDSGELKKVPREEW